MGKAGVFFELGMRKFITTSLAIPFYLVSVPKLGREPPLPVPLLHRMEERG